MTTTSSRTDGSRQTNRTAPRTATRQPAAATPARRSAVDRAYDRRRRRSERIAEPRLTMVGLPIRQTLARIPFVIVVIALLAAGGVGVLYLNTKTDEVGIRTIDSQQRAVELRLQSETLQREVAQLNSITEIARRAQAMGLVPAGDPAVIVINSGGATVVGTPSPATAVVAPPAVAQPTKPAPPVAVPAPAKPAPAKPAPAKPAPTKPAATTPAATTPAKVAATTSRAKPLTTSATAKPATSTTKAGR